MRSVWRWVPVLLLLVGSPARPDEAPQGDEDARAMLSRLSPEDLERLERDRQLVLGSEPVSDGGPRLIQALVWFRPPPAAVFALLTQTRRQVEYMSEVREVDPFPPPPDGWREIHRLRIAFKDIAYLVRYRAQPQELRYGWKLDPEFDNSIRSFEGFWQFAPYPDGGTLGQTGSRVDVGPLLPGFVQRALTRQKLPKVLERTRRWVDSGGTWRR